jgi:hypothetical protein
VARADAHAVLKDDTRGATSLKIDTHIPALDPTGTDTM